MEYFFNFEKIGYITRKDKDGCILCRLINNDPEIINTIVHKTEHMIIALNLYPYNPGHCLIFPVRHAEDFRELNEIERRFLNLSLDKTLNVLDELYKPSAYNMGFNMGLESGASIKHLHLHVIPRYPRELGVAELLAGKRVLVEDLNKTREKLICAFSGRDNALKEDNPADII